MINHLPVFLSQSFLDSGISIGGVILDDFDDLRFKILVFDFQSALRVLGIVVGIFGDSY